MDLRTHVLPTGTEYGIFLDPVRKSCSQVSKWSSRILAGQEAPEVQTFNHFMRVLVRKKNEAGGGARVGNL